MEAGWGMEAICERKEARISLREEKWEGCKHIDCLFFLGRIEIA